jgi:hypothetical protein
MTKFTPKFRGGRKRHSLTRRTLLVGGAAIGAAAAAGGISWFVRSPQDVVIGVIERRLPALDMDQGELRRFAIDFLRHDSYSKTFPIAIHGLRVTGSIVFSEILRSAMPAKAGRLVSKYEREILTLFMFSTDFFDTHAKNGSRVSYLGYYDPYERPCQDPLATHVSSA